MKEAMNKESCRKKTKNEKKNTKKTKNQYNKDPRANQIRGSLNDVQEPIKLEGHRTRFLCRRKSSK